MSSGTKHDSGKAPLNLLPTNSLIEIAKVLGFGASKYAAHNWKGGLKESRLIAAALRHIMAYNDGEDLDPESGISHIAHAGCCLMFLLDQHPRLPALDDRYKTSQSQPIFISPTCGPSR